MLSRQRRPDYKKMRCGKYCWSSIALIAFVSCDGALAFQAASSSTVLRQYIKTNISLRTLSKESLQGILQNEDDKEDEEDYDAHSWVLRQIKFLELSAARNNVYDGDNDLLTTQASDVGLAEATTMDARQLGEFLLEIGACSVSITDSDKGTPEEDPLFHEPGQTSCLNDLYDDDGDVTKDWAMVLSDLAVGRNVWKRCDVSAHFPASMDVPSIIDSVRYTFNLPATPRYTVDNVPDMDWIKHVQESWTPIVTSESKFVLRFPWHEDNVVMKACQEMERKKMNDAMAAQFSTGVKREGAVVNFYNEESVVQKQEERAYVQIELEGGIAFGTGEHPTTRLCLDWVRDETDKLLKSDSECINFIDYGAGSGVLGIAAALVVRDYNHAKRSQQPTRTSCLIKTVGVEIDADAIRIADDNAKKNGIEMKNYLPDIESLDGEALSVVMRAMQRKRNEGITTLPDELNGQMYDLCVANILARPLVGLAPVLASLVKPGGHVGLSGVLAVQAESVLEAYNEFFNDVKVASDENGWVLISGTRK